jgi:GNAT superfamily N-acetyltransferase
VSRDWQVRRIRVDEGLRLRALRLRALADAPTAFGSTHAREEKFAEEVWHSRAANGAAGLASVTTVAEQADRLVGMASGLAADPKEADVMGPVLVGMYVDRSVRRRGIGEALIESVKTWARSRGHDRLLLWAVSSNAPALALYRRCGFCENGITRPLSHTPNLSELQMLVPLAPGCPRTENPSR